MSTHRRESAAKRREIRRAVGVSCAADALGPILPGCEIYGLSDGRFSLIDLVEHLLGASGPADVVISTWTAAGADIDFALRFLADERALSMRWVVDFSFPSRQPAYCAALRERFGDNAIRVTKNHAKFVMVRNDNWDLVLRTSMNLNENRRMESFELSDDAGMAGYLAEVVDGLFAGYDGADQLDAAPGKNTAAFDAVAEVTGHGPPSMFDDGPAGVDLRRVGVSFD